MQAMHGQTHKLRTREQLTSGGATPLSPMCAHAWDFALAHLVVSMLQLAQGTEDA